MATKDDILDRAKELLKSNPSWTLNDLNIYLRMDYQGSYLKPTTFSKLKAELAKPAPAPYFHALVPSGREASILKAEGWVDHEIERLLGGLKIDLDRPVIQAMRKTRILWVTRLINKGYNQSQVTRAINDFYTDPERDVFAFLKAEYKPPDKITMEGYREAYARRVAPAPTTTQAQRNVKLFYARKH